jgi:hypothetical protein
MEKIVAYCGLACSDCIAFIATHENDDAKRKEVSAIWTKEYGRVFKPEEINCDGCVKDGKHFGYCNICEIRKCGTSKGVTNCAHCDSYGCEKIMRFFTVAPKAKETLEHIRQELCK